MTDASPFALPPDGGEHPSGLEAGHPAPNDAVSTALDRGLGERRGPPVPLSQRMSEDDALGARAPTSSPGSLGPAEPAKGLSFWVKPMIWLHRLVSRDGTQRREWVRRIEAIEQAADIDAEPSTEGKAILSDLRAWRQVKSTGLVGAGGGMALAAVWMSWLLPMYAIGHGFGWLVASAYLLPVPFAWRFGRRLWEKAALQGMKELGPNPTPQQQLRTLSAGMLRGMAAGAGMGFSLVFLQALISWFMTPAPTLISEIILDLFHGVMGGMVGATVGAVFGPLVGRGAPSGEERRPLLPEPSSD